MLLTLGLLAAAFGAAWAFCRFTGKTLGFLARKQPGRYDGAVHG